MSPTWYSEILLAERLDVSLGVMFQLRTSLKKNEVKKHNGGFFIHERAAERLLKDLGSPHLDISACALDNGSEPPAPIVIELTIDRVYLNPRLIRARRDDTGALVDVKVPNNTNFQPRMKIKARAPVTADGPQLYTLEGRCPRFRGKW